MKNQPTLTIITLVSLATLITSPILASETLTNHYDITFTPLNNSSINAQGHITSDPELYEITYHSTNLEPNQLQNHLLVNNPTKRITCQNIIDTNHNEQIDIEDIQTLAPQTNYSIPNLPTYQQGSLHYIKIIDAQTTNLFPLTNHLIIVLNQNEIDTQPGPPIACGQISISHETDQPPYLSTQLQDLKQKIQQHQQYIQKKFTQRPDTNLD